MMRKNDYRARTHPAYWAFLVHRLSGLGLALFLPVHFWALGKSVQGLNALDSFIRVTDQPLFKFGEWGLVILLSLHLMGGIRLLLIEFLPWTGLRKNWLALGLGASTCAGLAFLLALMH
jgi:fumarate reductase subunit D